MLPVAASERAKRAGVYLRVSRVDQNSAMQSHEARAMIERRGWTLHSEFSDEGISGAKKKRPGLDALLAAAKRREIDVVVVYRADRLFRSLLDFMVTLDELRNLGVDFVSVHEPFDTTTPMGRLLFTFVAAFAEFERESLRVRTRSGVAEARRRGKQLGRPRRTIDWTRVRELRGRGKTWDQIAQELDVSRAKLLREVKVERASS